MFRPPKTIIVIGIVAAVILAALYMLPAYAWEEGAPTATINVKITEADGTGYTGDFGLEPASIMSSLTTYPLTTYTADVPPLSATGIYTIAFTITVNTLGNVPEQYTTDIAITGHNNKTSYPITGFTGPVTYGLGFYATGGTTSAKTITNQYNTPTPAVMPVFDGVKQQHGEIQGEFIDGSTFLINIISQGPSGSYGMTSATVNLVVGAGGSLYVSIDNISTEVA